MTTPATATGRTGAPLLRVADLSVDFASRGREIRAVDQLSLEVHAGECLAIVGESGSGKSVTCQAVLGLLDPRAAKVSGRAELAGEDLLTMPPRQLRAVRGDRVAMIFQDPASSLNPVLTIGRQIAETFRFHSDISRQDALERAVELMGRVEIPAASSRAGDYPHQFSGGMKQRAMIAMAIALEPDLLIADEPTTALDVTVQDQILQLLRRLQADTGMGMIFISHDMGVVAQVADRVAVMYAGRIVETGTVSELFRSPAHPYTVGLLRSTPRMDVKARLEAISGQPPTPGDLPEGCPFHPRCDFAVERCLTEEPLLEPLGSGRASACHERLRVLGKARTHG